MLLYTTKQALERGSMQAPRGRTGLTLLRKRIVRNPKREIVLFSIALVVIGVAFFAVLNYFVSLQHPPTSSAELTVGPLQYSLVMPRTRYSEGSPIPLKMSIRNVTPRNVTLSFDQDLEFDFIVQKDVNLIFARVPLDIWRYSVKHGSEHKPHERVLKPGQARTFEATWEQTSSKGEPVGPGRYLITGVVNMAGGEHQSLQIRGNTE